jgi:uncharacterized protein (DUF952 family)
MPVSLIYHVTATAWGDGRRSGAYTASTIGKTLDEVGFLHGSDPGQISKVAAAIAGDGHGGPLVILVIDTGRLVSPLRWDDVPGFAAPFPHIYGPLNPDAVVDVVPVEPGPTGRSGSSRLLRKPEA